MGHEAHTAVGNHKEGLSLEETVMEDLGELMLASQLLPLPLQHMVASSRELQADGGEGVWGLYISRGGLRLLPGTQPPYHDI